MIRPLLTAGALLLAAPALSGCLALTVADAATSVAVGTVKTGAKVGGAVVGGAADAVTTTDRERCLKDARREKFDRRLCYEGRRQVPQETARAEIAPSNVVDRLAGPLELPNDAQQPQS